MINNSNLYRWDRLAPKSLDQQFVNEIIHGLNCSPFEAEAVLETVHRVFGDYFDACETLKPGQIVWNAVSTKTRADSANVRFVPVTLTIIDEHDIEKKDPLTVAKETNHSQWAMDRYIKDFNRVRLCYQDGKDKEFIALATGLSKFVVNEYISIIENSYDCP